jgi:hypothetical protein
MSAKFLSDQLMKSMKFRPGHEDTRPSDGQETVREKGAGDGLQQILDREDAHTRSTVARRDISETRRRREEVLELLDTTVQDLRREKEFFDEKLVLFAELAQNLRDHPEDFEASELLDVKQKMRAAHMEVAKFVREKEGGGERSPATASPRLSFGELTRMGLSLTWPLILAVLVGTVTLVAVLYTLFSV